MRLTLHTDYALRVLIYLGLRPDEVARVHDIAASYRISENHLMKVVNRLAQLGYVQTVRGRNGGLRLARSPAAIRIGDVVRHTEDDLALVECFDARRNACAIAGTCRLTGILDEALQAFLAVLDRYTLDDILAPAPQLAKLLGLPAT
jgi:Rrf2 family nitric oxide-sensitive transcriptional repressor